MKNQYLEFYNHCAEKGAMYDMGLCLIFSDDDNLRLFEPTKEDRISFRGEMYYDEEIGDYWASDDFSTGKYDFGPTRQNIVLFLAAMNNEL